MNQFVKFVVHHPKIVIAIVLAATCGFAVILIHRGIPFNGSPETLARKDSALDFFHETRKTFGDDRVIIVALTTEDALAPAFIDKLDRLTKRLAVVDGVDDVQSLTTLQAIRRRDDGVVIERLIPPDRRAPEQLRALRDEITRDPLYARQFISTDGRTAAINVFLKLLDEAEARKVAEAVERAARAENSGDELFLAGVPVMDAHGVRQTVRDMVVLSPIAAVLCFLIFLAAFRRFWCALLPMAALLIGLMWTIGLMAWLDRPITLATLSLPTTLMAVGGSYLFHVLNQHRLSMAALDAKAGSAGRAAAWVDGMNFINPAVLVSGTMTMAGFGALASSPVPAVRDMGLFSTLGVAMVLALTLAFVPAMLALLPLRATTRTRASENDYAAWLNGGLRKITALILFRRRAVLIVTLALTFIIGAGATRLRINTDYLKIFPRNSEVVTATEKLHERLSGAASIEIVVSGGAGAIKQLDTVRRVDALEAYALTQPGVDAAISITDPLKQLYGALAKTGPTAGALPPDDGQLRALFDDYLSQEAALNRLVSRDYSHAIILLRTNLFSSNALRDLTRNLDAWARANLPAGLTAQATGSVILLNTASDGVADSQLSSLAIALVSIYLMMVILFRSFATGLLALLPNLLPIIAYFGVLGWTGITLDITTSLVASAVLGLAVDNAVHMIRRYRQVAAARRPAREAEGWVMWLTMLRTGKPMVLANLMLIAAFLLFVLSSFMPVRVAGMLWAVTILACLAADLIFLPALMQSKRFRRAALPEGETRASAVEPVDANIEQAIK